MLFFTLKFGQNQFSIDKKIAIKNSIIQIFHENRHSN